CPAGRGIDRLPLHPIVIALLGELLRQLLADQISVIVRVMVMAVVIVIVARLAGRGTFASAAASASTFTGCESSAGNQAADRQKQNQTVCRALHSPLEGCKVYTCCACCNFQHLASKE